MTQFIESDQTRDSGREVSLGRTWVDLGSSLNRFKIPDGVAVRVRDEETVASVLSIPMLQALMKRSISLHLPVRYPLMANVDMKTQMLSMGTHQEHVTQVFAAFMNQHKELPVQIASDDRRGIDILFNGMPRPDGLTVPMFEGQEIRIAVLARDTANTVVFSHALQDK